MSRCPTKVNLCVVCQLSFWDLPTSQKTGSNTKDRAGHGLMDYGVPGGNGGQTVVYSGKHLSKGNPVPIVMRGFVIGLLCCFSL